MTLALSYCHGLCMLQGSITQMTKPLAVISTIEPENVKTILATKFQDYSLGKGRQEVFGPIFGDGIFTQDGKGWERSRALIRPNFVRQQVADLDMFESHVGHLIKAIPRNGSTIDLQDLFFSLTMDSATEFLFGKSTNTLAPGLETKSTDDFVKAYVYLIECKCSLRNFINIHWLFRLLKSYPYSCWNFFP